jgi:hypothetical protein
VGKTKQGKGMKLMTLVDGSSLTLVVYSREPFATRGHVLRRNLSLGLCRREAQAVDRGPGLRLRLAGFCSQSARRGDDRRAL